MTRPLDKLHHTEKKENVQGSEGNAKVKLKVLEILFYITSSLTLFDSSMKSCI